MISEQLANFNGRVYFFCLPRTETEGGDQFQHLFICLAEGFKELGISIFSNINYWQESPDSQEYLFRHSPDITPNDCSIVIFSNNWFNSNYPSPENLFHSQRKYVTVYLDGNDNNQDYDQRPEYKQFDFVLRTHYNRHLNYPSNFYPWGFGLSNRILKELQDLPKFQDRKKQILINFRHWQTGHPVRNFTSSLLIPEISKFLAIDNSVDDKANYSRDPYHYLHWLQTGARHYPSYYQRLKNSMACACFGGFFVPSFPQKAGSLINRNLQKIMTRLKLKSHTVAQWDSWRLWESLAAGCATFHLDFDKYGITLPTMPVKWQHYIGIDLDDIKTAIDRINDDPNLLETIAFNGRNWAIENYSPLPTALRFLEIIYQQKIVIQ
ncbi:MAG: glycosyltransferase family 1 protein [Nostocales cyanobacterium]|nr:MAG: glycosyltransferase family 1 protein [Nostocales cyanobacterium]